MHRWVRARVRGGSAAAVVVAVFAVLVGGCASPPARLAIALTSQAANADPGQPVTVVAHGGQLSTVQMTNASTGAPIAGVFSDDHRGWHSSPELAYGTTYHLDVLAQGDDDGQARRSLSVTTLTPAGQAGVELIPGPDSVAATGVGVGQPLDVQFTHPVSDRAGAQTRLRVTTTPPQPGAWFWMDDQHVHYRPAQFWKPGTVIDLDARLYGASLGGGIYGAQDVHATYRVHDALIAEADGNTDQMAILQNGKLINTLPISMGKGSTPTHSGIHVVSDKDQTVQMNSCSFGICSGPQAYNVTEHWAERISNDGEFVHQNPDSVSAQGSTNVSHGCINLNEANSQWFFQHFGLGDVVEVTNSGGGALPIWDTYGDWSLPWPQWQTGKPPAGQPSH